MFPPAILLPQALLQEWRLSAAWPRLSQLADRQRPVRCERAGRAQDDEKADLFGGSVVNRGWRFTTALA